MKFCPGPRCGAEISGTYFCCSRHWKTIPQFYRDRLSDVYYQSKKQELSESDVNRIEADTCDRMGWQLTDELAMSRVGVNYTVCGCCGQKSLIALNPEGTGTVALDEVRNEATRVTEAKRLTVVVGYFALPAAANQGGYTTFVPHTCPIRARDR